MAQWHQLSWTRVEDRTSVYIYAGLVLGLVIVSFVSCLLLYIALINSATNLHDSMVASVAHAPVLFFDTSPSGRILNRFSKDTSVMDEDMPYVLHESVQQCCMLIMSVLVPALTNYWVVLMGIPLAAVTWYYGRSCIRVSRELARLDAINRSFVYSHFANTLDGMVTIRAHKKQTEFERQFYWWVFCQCLWTDAFVIHINGRSHKRVSGFSRTADLKWPCCPIFTDIRPLMCFQSCLSWSQFILKSVLNEWRN